MLIVCVYNTVCTLCGRRKASLALIRKMVHYSSELLLKEDGVHTLYIHNLPTVLVEITATVLDQEVHTAAHCTTHCYTLYYTLHYIYQTPYTTHYRIMLANYTINLYFIILDYDDTMLTLYYAHIVLYTCS